jgi:uncharacterized protein involved in exopolysaccharide biosynthesis
MEPDSRNEWLDDEVNLLDYWRVLRKRGWMIFGLAFASVFATGYYSYFIATKIYESKAAILAPKESSGGGASGLASLLTSSAGGQALGGFGGGLGGLFLGGGTNRDAFIAILKSRTMAEEIVSRFNLKEYYEKKFTEDAIRALQEVTDISVSKEGVISVRVEDKDPKLAADIANIYVTNLDRLFAKLGTTDASRQRRFVAERLDKTEKGLSQAEGALRRFQEKNKAIVLTEQSKSAIEAAAKVRGQIAAAEVQLEVTRGFATENNPDVLALKRQIGEMKRQLARMEYGKGLELSPENMDGGQDKQEFQVPFTKVPELGMELVRLMRELKIQETMFNLLTAQYEQAKISEARDTPNVQVLDRAIPAERKSKPKTTINMAIAGVLSLFVGIFLAFFLEYLERMRNLKPAST